MLYGAYTAFRIIDVMASERKAGGGLFQERPWAALSFREQGNSTFTLGEQVLTVGDNTILYIPANVGFSRQSFEERLIVLHLETYGTETREAELLQAPDPVSTRTFFRALLSLWEEKSIGYEHRATAMLHHFLAGLYSAEYRPLSRKAEALIRRGVDYLSMHFTDPTISTHEIAAHCSVSEEYFRRLYKEAFGVSPHNAIVEKRLQFAMELLRTTDLSVEEIALQSGFADCKYFSTVFHKKIKLSPSSYRKAMMADA